jgi:hypothetical protein
MMANDADPGVILRGPQQGTEGAVARAIVDEEHSPIVRAGLLHPYEATEERGQTGLLVVTRNDQGDGSAVGEHVTMDPFDEG